MSPGDPEADADAAPGDDADTGGDAAPDRSTLDEWTDRVGATDESRPGDRVRAATDTPDSDPDPVELGVALLSRLEHAELSVADALDRIEAVTTAPETQRAILETAQERGVVERDGATLRPARGTGGGYVSFESEVVVRHGEFTCQRCGADIGEGHFVRLDPGEVGPYGSSCIKKVVGRE
jgi:hypothetical protein